MKYLHEVHPGHFYLDHRLTPEVRAMFCAMASRAPLGGIQARYAEVVEAIYQEIRPVAGLVTFALQKGDPGKAAWAAAEEFLTQYPLHPRVQKFFDLFVGKYGHSSVMELVGSPSVYVEGVSWYTAYRSFDNPLVKGQEFSTRAVRHRDWPMARECFDLGQIVSDGVTGPLAPALLPNPTLKALHEGWFEIFEAEVEAWRQEYTSACPNCFGDGWYQPERERVSCPPCKGTGKKYPTADKEPFRPALDRARWALPGTIATGFSHTADLRTMARVINDGTLLARASDNDSALQVWNNIADTYRQALPGLAGNGLKEAVYSSTTTLPMHLLVGAAPDGPEVEVDAGLFRAPSPSKAALGRPFGKKAYLDPMWNHMGRAEVTFRCSLAVSRDWHRHRTMMPWTLDLVWAGSTIKIHSAYEPRSDLGKARLPELLRLSSRAYKDFEAAGDHYRAMLSLPLGTLVRMTGQGGLRDVVYMLELRRDAVGANFEYQAQAKTGMDLLVEQLREHDAEYGDLPALLGLSEPSSTGT